MPAILQVVVQAMLEVVVVTVSSPLLHKGWVCTVSSYREKEMSLINSCHI